MRRLRVQPHFLALAGIWDFWGRRFYTWGTPTCDNVRKLHDELQGEQRKLAAANDEITALTVTARSLLEKETRERQKHEEEVLKKHEEVADNIDQHKAARDLAHAGLENQLGNYSKMHQSEKDERAREAGEFRRCLQVLEEKINTMAAEIRLEHEMDKKRLGESTVTFDRTLNDLRGVVDSHTQRQNKKHGDHNESIQSLRDELEQEIKTRTKEKTNFMTALNSLTMKMEKDNSDRQATQNELSERWMKQLEKALSLESQERKEGLQQERSVRDQCLISIRQNLENCKTGLNLEKDERAAEFAIFTKKAATTESQLLQLIDDIKLGLEGEVNLRVTGDDRIERRLGELRGNFDAHTTSSTSLMHEIDHQMRALSQTLDTEVRSRSDESNRHSAATNQLKEMLASSESHHAKNCDAINDKIKAMGDTLLEHEKGRVSAGEELIKKVKAVTAMIEVERYERDQSDVNTKSSVEGLRQALATEKEERINDLSAFRRNMQVEDGKVKQAFEDLKHLVEIETGKRSAADERIEKRTNEYKVSLDEIAGRCTEITEDLDKVTRVLRQGLDQEARLRSDDAKKMQTATNRVQDLVEAEVGDRQQACADLMERIRALLDNLSQEAKERAAGDDESARLVITVRQSLEREVKERKLGESEADQRLHDLSAAIDHEKIDREHEDTVLRTQVSGLRQEMDGEKNRAHC